MAAAKKTDLCKDNWVLEQVEFCIAHGLNSLLLVEPACELVIAGPEKLFIKRLARTVKSKWHLSQGDGHFSLRHSSLEEGDPSLAMVRAEGRPLSELQWECAFHQAEGRLLPGCRRDDVVKLNAWPNLTRLSRTKNSFRIAALLNHRPTSPVLASRILNVDEKEVYQFYSAAKYAGLTDTINRDGRDNRVVTMAAGHGRNLGFIRRLLQHLEGKQEPQQQALVRT